MDYLFKQCQEYPDGSMMIPASLVEHWDRQVHTKYADLTGQEKESDREQVRKFAHLVGDQKWIDALEAAGVDNWDGYTYAIDVYQGRG